MKLIKTVLFYVGYVIFLIVVGYTFGVAVARAEECGPSKLEYPIKDMQIDVKEILKKLLQDDKTIVIIKS